MKVLPAKNKELRKSTEVIASASPSPNSPPSHNSLDDYENLKLKIFMITLTLSGLIFGILGVFYGLKIALNYLLGACAGVVYLKMLARSVDDLGRQTRRLGYSRLGIFISVIIVATRLDQLLVLPVFLGFLTYKAAILVYLVQDFMPTTSIKTAIQVGKEG